MGRSKHSGEKRQPEEPKKESLFKGLRGLGKYGIGGTAGRMACIESGGRWKGGKCIKK